MSALQVWAREPGPGSIAEVLGALAVLPADGGAARNGQQGRSHKCFTPEYAMVALPGRLVFTRWDRLRLSDEELEQSLWGRLFSEHCELRWANDLGTHYWVMLSEQNDDDEGKTLTRRRPAPSPGPLSEQNDDEEGKAPGEGWEAVPAAGLDSVKVTHACFGTSLEDGRGWTEQRIWPLIINYPCDVLACRPQTRLSLRFFEYRSEGRPVFTRLARVKTWRSKSTQGGKA